MDLRVLLEYLEKNYLPRARWWPWKNTVKPIELYRYEANGSLVYMLIKSGEHVFQLPLLHVNSVPRELSDRGFCIDTECFIEAEYSPVYLDLFENLERARVEVIENKEMRSEAEYGYPLTLESTNVLAVYVEGDKRYVMKSYRLLPEVNLEVSILKLLAQRRYNHIPRVKCLLYYDELASGILMEYIQGIGDGGYPFYRSLVRYLAGERGAHELGLSAKLGVIIAGLHITLNSGLSDELFGPEEFSTRDKEGVLNRIERMYKQGLKRVDEVLGSLESDEREEVEYWRRIAEMESSTVENAINLIDKQSDVLLKARTHQDLHLAQMIYIGDGKIDFVITDFEGEPGRSSKERLVKEPLLRDVASMIRSFHYLSHAALMESIKQSRHIVSKTMIEDDPSLEWRYRHIVAFTYAYLAEIHDKGLITRTSVRPSDVVWTLLYPWIVERAVYEFYYESMYRPLWISIPIAGLVEVRKVFQPKLH